MKPIYNRDGSLAYQYSIFGEKPDTNLAIMAAVVFFLIFFGHLAQGIRTRAKYMSPAIAGALMEAVGYSIRIASIQTPFNLVPYMMQQAFIIVAPIFIAYTQYVLLGKIIERVDESSSPIKHGIIAKVFVGSDIVTFIIQGGASSLLVAVPTQALLAQNLLVAGVVLQVVSFLCYLSIAIIFYVRVSRSLNKI